MPPAQSVVRAGRNSLRLRLRVPPFDSNLSRVYLIIPLSLFLATNEATSDGAHCLKQEKMEIH